MPTNPITKAREKLGITQAELARLSGLTYQRVWQLENGVRDPRKLSVEIALRIAKALRVSVERLFGDEAK